MLEVGPLDGHLFDLRLVRIALEAAGFVVALILGVARGVGETSPVLLTSGVATFFVTAWLAYATFSAGCSRIVSTPPVVTEPVQQVMLCE